MARKRLRSVEDILEKESSLEEDDGRESTPRKKHAGKKHSTSSKSTEREGVVREEPSSVKAAVEDSKKFFQRIWDEHDELTLLRGMLEYGVDAAFSDGNGFYFFIKKSLHLDVSKIQLIRKMRSLHKKFDNNLKRVKNDRDPIFSKEHSARCFQLSKKIWGVCPGQSLETDGKSEGESAWLSNMEEKVLKGLKMLEKPKRKKMKQHWREFGILQLRLFLKRNELITEQAVLMLESEKAALK